MATDTSLFAGAAVLGIPLVFVVMGLTQWAKSFGLSGNWLRVVSLALGVIFGVSFQISQNGVPADFAGGFADVFYGLALGLVASGVYDSGKDIGASVVEKALAVKK